MNIFYSILCILLIHISVNVNFWRRIGVPGPPIPRLLVCVFLF